MKALQDKQRQQREFLELLDARASTDVPQRIERMRALQYDEGKDLFAVQYTTIHKSAIDGNVAGIRYFVSMNATMVDKRDKAGKAPLHHAAARGHKFAVRALATSRADVNIKTKNTKLRPIHLAAAGGHWESIVILHEFGARLNATDNAGCAACHYAAQSNQVEALRTLLDLDQRQKEHEMDVLNQKTRAGMTPLHYAATFDNADAIEFLLTNRVQVDEVDSQNETALHKAARAQAHVAYDTLVAGGASEQVLNREETTPAMMRSNINRLDVRTTRTTVT